MPRGGSSAKLQIFLVASTCLLYLVAAGLFSRGVWHLEAQKWNNAIGGDASETGNGPGSYDIDKSVWHVNVRFYPHVAENSGTDLFPVLLTNFHQRRRLGSLQRHSRLAKLCDLRVRHLIQRLLDLCHGRIHPHAIQGDQGSLAVHEAQTFTCSGGQPQWQLQPAGWCR